MPPLPPRSTVVSDQPGQFGTAHQEKGALRAAYNMAYNNQGSSSSGSNSNVQESSGSNSSHMDRSSDAAAHNPNYNGSVSGSSLDAPRTTQTAASNLSFRGSASLRGVRPDIPQHRNNSNSKLLMKQSNSLLELNESWTGRECQLKNSNGNIQIHGSLNANKNIHLESQKGCVTIDGQLLATKDIYIKVNNGAITINGDSIISKNLRIENNNSPLQLESFIEAKKICFKTKNAPITINNMSVGSHLYAKTTNSPINIYIHDIGNIKDARFNIETTNAPVNVYVPNKYAGKFDVRSKSGTAVVWAKSVNKTTLLFTKEESDYKTGVVKNIITGDKKTNASIVIRTNKAPAILYIE